MLNTKKKVYYLDLRQYIIMADDIIKKHILINSDNNKNYSEKRKAIDKMAIDELKITEEELNQNNNLINTPYYIREVLKDCFHKFILDNASDQAIFYSNIDYIYTKDIYGSVDYEDLSYNDIIYRHYDLNYDDLCRVEKDIDRCINYILKEINFTIDVIYFMKLDSLNIYIAEHMGISEFRYKERNQRDEIEKELKEEWDISGEMTIEH